MNWTTSTLGERIWHICKLRGFSLSELGRRVGMESGPMSNLAKHPEHVAGSPRVLMKLSDAGNVSLEWLLCGRGPVERGENPLIRARNEWRAALDEAKRRFPFVPEHYFDEVGNALDSGRALDAEFVGRSAQILYEADLRAERHSVPENAPASPPQPKGDVAEAAGTARAGKGKRGVRVG